MGQLLTDQRSDVAWDEPAVQRAGIGGPAALLAWLENRLAAERDRWFLWSPIGLALGIALYWGLPVEPPSALGLAGLVLAALVAWRCRHQGWAGFAALALFIFILGFSAAQLRTLTVGGNALSRPASLLVTGTIRSNERDESGARILVIAPERLGDLSSDRLPPFIRMTSRFGADAELRPGDRVEVDARLLPPPEPVEPYGYDYARDLWFRGIGAVGYTYGATRILGDRPASWVSQAAYLVQSVRQRINERVREVLAGETGALASALMTGSRGAISEPTAQALRDTGLAHVLAISGLHMSLLAGAGFWAIRLALTLPLALRFPVKKIAAIGALVIATLYLGISGASIATQRAFIMVAIMFLAILVDRPALTMRNVAIAAWIVLLWSPESLLSAGFQMSFAAVVALIATYEAYELRLLRARSMQQGARSMPVHLLVLLGAYIAGLLVTSLVAGLATMPFAAFHFNRIANYGLIANLMAMPLIGTLVMPCALAAFLLMPFGLEYLALRPMGWALDLFTAIAEWIAGWPGAVSDVATGPPIALYLIVFGGLWLALWRTTWRYAGLAAIGLGVALSGATAIPDLWIDRDGATIAMRGDQSLQIVWGREGFAAENWARRRALKFGEASSMTQRPARCDSEGCVATLSDGRPLTVAHHLAALAEDCRTSAIIIARVYVPREMRRTCRALLIDRGDIQRDGAHTLFLQTDGSVRIDRAADVRGRRPWVTGSGQ